MFPDIPNLNLGTWLMLESFSALTLALKMTSNKNYGCSLNVSRERSMLVAIPGYLLSFYLSMFKNMQPGPRAESPNLHREF